MFRSFYLTLTLQSLLFFNFLASFVFRFSLLFGFRLFLFFSKDFRGSAKSKNLVFFSGFPLFFFSKKQGLEGQGSGLVAGDFAICGRLVALTLRLGCDLGSSAHHKP